jgi:hypothetical protein
LGRTNRSAWQMEFSRWRDGQIVRLGRRNSQGEETDRSFGLADGILKAKRRSAGGGASKGRGPTGVGPARVGKDWGGGGSSTGGGVKGGVFFFFFFFLGPPSFSWGWLEWRSHGLPTLVIIKESWYKNNISFHIYLHYNINFLSFIWIIKRFQVSIFFYYGSNTRSAFSLSSSLIGPWMMDMQRTRLGCDIRPQKYAWFIGGHAH